MTDDEIGAAVLKEMEISIGYQNSEIASDRAKALRYYLGEEFGNEIEGRSKVVITEVADAVGAALPMLIKTFAVSENAVEFEPMGPQDELLAQQETEYVSHVFFQKNNGVQIIHDWFWDALVQKNGVVKVWYEEKAEDRTEEYEGLVDIQLAQLLQDPDLKPVEHDTYLDDETGVTLHDIKVEYTKKEGCAKVAVVPPGTFYVSNRTDGIDLRDAYFVAQRTRQSKTDLLAMGFKESDLTQISGDGAPESMEELARNFYAEESPVYGNHDLYWLTEAYYRVDKDNDGVDELVKVMMVENTILEIEEVDFIPFVAITPYPLPHKFYGLSMADNTMDLQLVKSTVVRQLLDNMYNMNNGKVIVDEAVNMEDLLTPAPGYPIRVSGMNGVGDHASFQSPTPLPSTSFDLIGYLDQVKENRTGINRNLSGQNYDVSNDTAHGIERIMTASEARMELVARLFAEGMKRMFLMLHATLMKYQDFDDVIKLNSQWIPVNPREWKERTQMRINVGVGSGQRDKKFAQVQNIIQNQKDFLGMGLGGLLVTPKNIYNAMEEQIRLADMQSVDPYFQDPDGPEAQQFKQQQAMNSQQQQDPLVQMEHIKSQYKLQIEQMSNQMEQLKQEYQAQLKMHDMANKNEMENFKAQFSAANAEADRRSREEIAEMNAKVQLLLKAMDQKIQNPQVFGDMPEESGE